MGTGPGEKAAIAAGRWGEFLAEHRPPPSWFRVVARVLWNRAHTHALRILPKTERVTMRVANVWVGEAEVDETGHHWERGTIVLVTGRGVDVDTIDGWCACAWVRATAEATTAPYLVASSSYSPSIQLEHRNALYGVVLSGRMFSIENVELAVPLCLPRDAPDRAPQSGYEVVPAFDAESLADEDEKELRAALAILNELIEHRG